MVQTPDLTYYAYYTGFITVLLSIPIVCILDHKYREVPNWIWCAMLIPNIPALFILYAGGLPLTYLAISIGLIGLYCVLWCKNWIGGADAKYLAVIALAVPLSPFSYEPFQFTFYICLAIVLGCLPFVVYFRNLRNYHGENMWTYWPRGIPYMIPISIAFIMAVFV